MIHPSCLVPTVQVCGGSVVIWGGFSWSGLGSEMLFAQTIRSGASSNVAEGEIQRFDVFGVRHIS